MIKRRYYKLEHGDRDAPSESSSSSSDSELEAEATEDSDETEDDAQVRQEDEYASSTSGLPTSDEDVEPRIGRKSEHRGNTDSTDLQLSSEAIKDEKDPSDFPECVVKCKSVFKCKLCPRIVCLSEETLNAHLKSKGHERSEKLFREGRVNLVLDMDGKSDEETAPPVASTEKSGKSWMKKRGWRGQKSRLKKKKKT